MQKCGYIAILGRPNAGKSSLLNTLVGQKIAGVSAKPQTTRARILGIRIEDESQLLFLDTPGIHRSQRKIALNSLMNRAAWSVLNEADAVLYLIDATDPDFSEDFDFLKNVLKSANAPVILCLNKTDRIRRDSVDDPGLRLRILLQNIKEALTEEEYKNLVNEQPLFISAKRRESLSDMLELLKERLPEGEWLYPADDLTDRSQKFVCSELIREQAFRCLGAELPYHLAVKVDTIDFEPNIVRVEAEIIVGRPQHKGIVVGRAGAKIKEIGSKARVSMERHFDQKVFLELNVTVDSDWVNDPRSVTDYSEMDDINL